MNTSYTNNGRFDSENGNCNRYFLDALCPVGKRAKVADLLLSVLSALIAFPVSARTRRVAKPLVVALCLVALIGVIGAMETGVLALGAGIAVGLALVAVEYLCLRRR